MRSGAAMSVVAVARGGTEAAEAEVTSAKMSDWATTEDETAQEATDEDGRAHREIKERARRRLVTRALRMRTGRVERE